VIHSLVILPTYNERENLPLKLNRGVLLESALLPWRLAMPSLLEDATAERWASRPENAS